MIREEIKKFMALAPLMMPRLIGDKVPDDTEITDDCALLYFPLEEKMPIGWVMDTLEDDMEMLLLYHGTDNKNPKIHHCCFFANPASGTGVYKINLITDDKSVVSGLSVSIYFDPLILEDDLESDLAAHAKNFSFIQSMTDADVITLFCSLA